MQGRAGYRWGGAVPPPVRRLNSLTAFSCAQQRLPIWKPCLAHIKGFCHWRTGNYEPPPTQEGQLNSLEAITHAQLRYLCLPVHRGIHQKEKQNRGQKKLPRPEPRDNGGRVGRSHAITCHDVQFDSRWTICSLETVQKMVMAPSFNKQQKKHHHSAIVSCVMRSYSLSFGT